MKKHKLLKDHLGAMRFYLYDDSCQTVGIGPMGHIFNLLVRQLGSNCDLEVRPATGIDGSILAQIANRWMR